MGERDAFGREIGEDPLAELGWRTTRPTRPDAGVPAPRRRVRGAAVHGAGSSSSRRRRCPAISRNGGAVSAVRA